MRREVLAHALPLSVDREHDPLPKVARVELAALRAPQLRLRAGDVPAEQDAPAADAVDLRLYPRGHPRPEAELWQDVADVFELHGGRLDCRVDRLPLDRHTLKGKDGKDGKDVKGCQGIIVICKGGDGGDGGDGSITLLWAFADEIVEATVGQKDRGKSRGRGYRKGSYMKEKNDNGERNIATATNWVETDISGALTEAGQLNLTALVVNNVYGFNQVANGMNISSGQVSEALVISAATGTVATSQINRGDQWRGAPKGYNKASTHF